MKTFKEECEEWLNPLGYHIHNHNEGYSYIVFVHKNIDQYYPSIICKESIDGDKKCSLRSSIKLFCTIESGDLQFKHPQINKWIDYMSKCEITCNSLSL